MSEKIVYSFLCITVTNFDIKITKLCLTFMNLCLDYCRLFFRDRVYMYVRWVLCLSRVVLITYVEVGALEMSQTSCSECYIWQPSLCV